LKSLFRLSEERAEKIIGEVVGAVRGWMELAKQLKVSPHELGMMKNAFRIAEK
jgi:hypothetical protein